VQKNQEIFTPPPLSLPLFGVKRVTCFTARNGFRLKYCLHNTISQVFLQHVTLIQHLKNTNKITRTEYLLPLLSTTLSIRFTIYVIFCNILELLKHSVFMCVTQKVTDIDCFLNGIWKLVVDTKCV